MDKTNPNNGGSNSGNYITGGTFHQTSFAAGDRSTATTIVTSDQGTVISADLIAVLEKLREQFAQARQAGIVDEKAVSVVTETVKQAQQPNPDKKTIIDRLNAVNVFIEDITAASGLVTAVVETIKVVQRLF